MRSDRIRDAIDNLVSNAIKYSPIGGAIDSWWRARATVYSSKSGSGRWPFAGRHLPAVRFQRLSAKPTAGETDRPGLSIVKRIVDLHGANHGRKRRSREGATFKMTLPVT